MCLNCKSTNISYESSQIDWPNDFILKIDMSTWIEYFFVYVFVCPKSQNCSVFACMFAFSVVCDFTFDQKKRDALSNWRKSITDRQIEDSQWTTVWEKKEQFTYTDKTHSTKFNVIAISERPPCSPKSRMRQFIFNTFTRFSYTNIWKLCERCAKTCVCVCRKRAIFTIFISVRIKRVLSRASSILCESVKIAHYNFIESLNDLSLKFRQNKDWTIHLSVTKKKKNNNNCKFSQTVRKK